MLVSAANVMGHYNSESRRKKTQKKLKRKNIPTLGLWSKLFWNAPTQPENHQDAALSELFYSVTLCVFCICRRPPNINQSIRFIKYHVILSVGSVK